MPLGLHLAATVKENYPRQFFAMQYLAAMLDADFEYYESALEHMQVALKTAEGKESEWPELVECRANYGYVLRKLKRYDEPKRCI
jgi:hypothetical protein